MSETSRQQTREKESTCSKGKGPSSNSNKKGKKKRPQKPKPLAKKIAPGQPQNHAKPDGSAKRNLGPQRKRLTDFQPGHSLKTKVLEDGQCFLVSVQMKSAKPRLQSLFNWVKTLSRPPDVIAIQDPPLQLAYSSLPSYQTWFRGDDGDGNDISIGEKDHPYHRDYIPPYPKAHEKLAIKQKSETQPDCKQLAKIAFLVHNSIQEWNVSEPPNGPNRGLVATLHIALAQGSLDIHNFYNHNHPNGRLDVEKLLEPCDNNQDAHIVVGDSNLQHPLWSAHAEGQNIHKKAKALVAAIEATNMVCKNDGSLTYARGNRSSGEYASSIDIILASGFLGDQCLYEVLDVHGYESDHAVTSLRVDMGLDRKLGLKFFWEETHVHEYNKYVAHHIDTSALPSNPNKADLMHALDGFREIIYGAIEEHVPVRHIFENKPSRKSTIPVSNTTKTTNWRKAVERKSENPQGVHSLAKRAILWGSPRPPKCTPDFVLTPDTIIRDNNEKVKCYVEAIWTRTRYKGPPRKLPTDSAFSQRYATLDSSGTTRAAQMSTSSTDRSRFPLPLLDPSRKQHFSKATVSEDEVESLLKDAPRRKACGVDGIPFEALKMCAEHIIPTLTWIFQTCLDLRLHPDSFKDCITFVIQKPGKDASLPKSYRPIALLNTLAKLLERIIADRLKSLVLEVEGMLPFTQFGAPGRSTTLAVELLTTKVYSGWIQDKKVSLLGLDLTGAYDHIDRAKLLDKLISLGIPDWLIEIIWSFLSDRRSYIHLPGHDGDEYYIDVGVPQGSPLSSLLFLFYAAPLLTDLAKKHNNVMLFSYVDDTYILVFARSYRENVRVMGLVHDQLYNWAEQNSMRFSPSKYHIMHFVEPGTRITRDIKADLKLLPSMIGFENLTRDEEDNIRQSTMTILGVVFDQRLSWVDHANYIKEKIRKKLKTYQRFSQSTWGVTLQKRHSLYQQHLLPIITYACAGWFLTDQLDKNRNEKLRYRVSKSAISILESLQTEILLFLSKAWKRTPRELIENEMHIIPITLKLHEVAMNHRCRKLDSREYEFMEKLRSPDGKEQTQHPHTQINLWSRDYERQIRNHKSLHCEEDKAYEKSWAKPATRKRWIENFFALKVFTEAKTRFDLWRHLQLSKDLKKHRSAQPAYKARFGHHTLQLYFGLDTAQQTMLLGMRTGNLGVNANPIFRNAIKSKDMSCPKCGATLHTVKHLLCECPALRRMRTYLMGAAGHNDFDLFMNLDTELATSWAIAHFGLAQFDSIKDKKKYQFPQKPEIVREEYWGW